MFCFDWCRCVGVRDVGLTLWLSLSRLLMWHVFAMPSLIACTCACTVSEFAVELALCEQQWRDLWQDGIRAWSVIRELDTCVCSCASTPTSSGSKELMPSVNCNVNDNCYIHAWAQNQMLLNAEERATIAWNFSASKQGICDTVLHGAVYALTYLKLTST